MIIGYAVVGLFFGAMFGILLSVLMRNYSLFRVYVYLFQAFAVLMMLAAASLVISVGLLANPTIFIAVWMMGEIVVTEFLCKFVK